MSFSDRIRAWFKGESKRQAPSPSTARANRTATKELDAFVRDRAGVEAFVEPKTAIYSTTVLLVAGDGEYLRRPVRDRAQAAEFAEKHGIPLYDAARVGYPRRMRDYDKGIRRDPVDLEDLPPWPGDAPGDDQDAG